MKKITSLATSFLLILSLGAYSQNVGINATGATPNNSSILDLNTGNTFTSPNGKGLLPPNVPLTSITDIVTVTSPATSLLIYNTATAGSGTAAVVPGYYYWNGIKWVAFDANDWQTAGNVGTTAGANFVGTTDAQDLVFKTNSIENMRILNTNGNVGIGTNAPATKLHVVGNVFVQSNPLQYSILSTDGGVELFRDPTSIVPNTSGYIDLKSNSGDDFRNRLYYNNSNAVNGSFGIITTTDGLPGTAAERLTILNSNGNLGIGTNTPTERLEVQGSVKIVDGTQGAGKLLVSDANGKASWANTTGTTTVINSNAGNAVPIAGPFVYTGANATIAVNGYYLISFRIIVDKSPIGCGSYIAFNLGTSSVSPTGMVVVYQDVHTVAGTGDVDAGYTSTVAYFNAGTYYMWIRSDGVSCTRTLRATIGENSFTLTQLK